MSRTDQDVVDEIYQFVPEEIRRSVRVLSVSDSERGPIERFTATAEQVKRRIDDPNSNLMAVQTPLIIVCNGNIIASFWDLRMDENFSKHLDDIKSTALNTEFLGNKINVCNV